MSWTLPKLMGSLHDRVSQELKTAREAIGHPGAKGDGIEKVWHKLFKTYLPARYAVNKATIMESTGISAKRSMSCFMTGNVASSSSSSKA